MLWLPLLLLSANDVWASYGSPLAGSPTVPPSSYEGGLVTNPNPMNNSSNSVITGNVRGGKHFRGPIPYDASTSFQAPLGSTRLDSFLRYSAVPDELGGYAPGYDTFYSPTGTASKFRPGQGGVFAPTSPRVAGGISQWRPDQPSDVVDLGDIRQSRVSVGETSSTADGSLDSWRRFGNWPLSRSPEQMRQVISDELGRQFTDDLASQQNSQPITSEEYRLQMEQFRQQLEKVKADASRLEHSLITGDTLPKDASQQVLSDPAEATRLRATVEGLTTPLSQAGIERRGDSDLLPKSAPLTPDISVLTRPPQASDAADIASIIAPRRLAPAPGAKGSTASESRLPVTSPQSSAGGLVPDAAARTDRIGELFLARGQGTGQTQLGSAGDLPALQRIKETAGALERPSRSSIYTPVNATDGAASAPDGVDGLTEFLPPTSGESDSLGTVDANKPATGELRPSEGLVGDQIRQTHQTLTSSSQERFDRYLKAAEMYMQQGKFYRAVESFSLASLYNPNDRRVYVGRSHALFAAGEYVSSATFLAKAIELDPNQTLAKLDLVNATGGPDLFLHRITDLEQCAKTGATPDLQLLLAYIYHQMDRPEEAKTAIEAAEKGLPHLSALDLLRAAIVK